MARTVEWKLVVDEEGSIKKMEMVGKEAEKVDKHFDETKHKASSLKESLKGLAGEFGGLKSIAGMALGAVGFGGAAFGLENVLSTTSSLAEETDKFQKTTGMGAQSSLDYVAALKARGIGAEAVTRAYKGLGKSVESAERQQYSYSVGAEKAHQTGRIYTSQLGSQAEAFQRLGVSTAQLKSLSPEKQFELITGKLEHMKGGLEKTNLATLLFGKGGMALLPVLEQGSLSLNKYYLMAKRFFPTLKGGAHTMEELQEKQAESKMAWEGLEFTLGMKLAPALSSVMGWFSKLIAELEHGHGVWGTVGKDTSMVAKDVKEVAVWIDKTHEVLYPLLGTLGLLGAAWGVEKVIGFYEAVKKLTLLQMLASTVKGFGVAVGLLPAEEEAATVATAGMDAAFVALLPEVLAVAAAVGEFTLKAPKSLGGEGGTYAEEAAKLLPFGPTTQAAGPSSKKEERSLRDVYKSDLEHHRYATPKIRAEMERQVYGHAKPLPHVAQPLHHPDSGHHEHAAHIHIDGVKVGEVVSRNARAMRHIAEGVERAVLQRTARK